MITRQINPDSALGKVIRRIRRDRLALSGLIVLVALYGTIFLAGFLAPYGENHHWRQLASAPPTGVYLFDHDGNLTRPYVFAQERRFDPETYEFAFFPKLEKRYPLKFFVRGDDYRLLGVIPSNLHFVGVDAPATVHLLGTDSNGRDLFSRLLYGGQLSLTIGFLGLLVAFPIGLLYGGISGFFGGWLDTAMMRLSEIIMSIPSFYLLISLAAILPPGLSSSTRFAMITVILAFIGWAGLSRVIRGMVLSLKNQEFVEASHAVGASSLHTITRHVLPQTASYIIVAMTLGVPGYILAESGLSFLGLGIQQPDASWGNMLKEAQDINTFLNQPWILMPGLLIFLAILAFNLVGDAVRDALDPKSQSRR